MSQTWAELEEDEIRSILVVDDEPDLTKLIGLILKHGTPHRVVEVNQPRRALELFETDPVDLVISDIEMPDMDGLAFLERIKALRPQTEVIMLTGAATFERAVTAIHRQAFDFLEKPPTKERILQTVRNALSRVSLREELERTVGDVARQKLLMERFGRDRLQYQTPHERLVAGGLVLREVRAKNKNYLDGIRQSLGRILNAGLVSGEAPEIVHSKEVELIRRALGEMNAADDLLETALSSNRRETVEIDVNAFVRDEANRFLSIYGSMQASLEIPEVPHILPVQTSGLALALDILLENSVQATARAGRVRVACHPTDSGVQIIVEDNGPGFPHDYEPHFAEPLKGTKGAGHAGMGLAIARHAIEEQHGTLVMVPMGTGGAWVEIRLAHAP